jgi:hypothetical protein
MALVIVTFVGVLYSGSSVLALSFQIKMPHQTDLGECRMWQRRSELINIKSLVYQKIINIKYC